MSSVRRTLYPEIQPYRTGRLRVSGGHELYFEESGNGSLFLLEMLDLIGYDAMSKVVSGIHQDSQARSRRMTDIFDLMRKNAPPDKAAAVDAVIDKWTKGVGLVKPSPTPRPR